jgi:SAM-dependent methyltransferase
MTPASGLRPSTLHSEEELAEAYGGRDWTFYRPLLAQLVEYAPPGRVLDAGAGTGLFVECCRRFGVPCVGVEGAEAGAAQARAKGLPVAVCRLEHALPFHDGAFATVVLNQVIEHLYPETAAFFLREAARVLMPGGILMIQSPSRRDGRQRAEAGHVNLYLPSRLRREVGGAGFEIIAERNGPLLPLGRGRIMKLFFTGLLRVTGWQDLLSSSANVVARKPLGSP